MGRIGVDEMTNKAKRLLAISHAISVMGGNKYLEVIEDLYEKGPDVEGFRKFVKSRNKKGKRGRRK